MNIFTHDQLIHFYFEMGPEERRKFMENPENAEAFLEWNELQAMLDKAVQRPRKQAVDAILAYADKAVTA